MPLATYGHYGSPLLLIPTASSNFEEHERMGMIGALSRHVEAGRVKLYTIDSINAESLSNYDIPPQERARRQALYDRYISQEVVPAIYEDCRGQLPIGVAGASFGAYHAANTLLRHPEQFRWCICMSGVYDISRCLDQQLDENGFTQNPPSYLPALSSEHRRQLSQCDIHLLCGQGPWERVHWSKDFSNALWQAQIQHNFDLWGHDAAHDWPWWHRQMDLYLGRLLN